MEINSNDFIFGPERPDDGPPLARERFKPTNKTAAFLKTCREKKYDISTIINMALDVFEPTTKNNNFTWEGIENVIAGKKKWFY